MATVYSVEDIQQFSEYYVIQNSEGGYLSNVGEDYDTMDEGGNYEFQPNIRYATSLSDESELPKYLCYHTDGTRVESVEHFLELIGGKVLHVSLTMVRKYEIKESR